MREGEKPIGVVDSGIGGLSVLQALVNRLPRERWLYFADQAHLPYGARPASELRRFGRRIVAFLLEQGIKALVVACNTLSAAALDDLRAAFPHLPIVGMEPAVKPAAQASQKGVIGVLATRMTLRSERYLRLKERFGQGKRFLEDPCVGLVERIESGDVDGPATQALLERVLTPMKQAGVDTVVLGCTHYPFVLPHIRRFLGPQVTILNPAEAVARHLARVLESRNLLRQDGPGAVLGYFTTGQAETFTRQIRRLTPELEAPVQALPHFWQEET